MNRWKSYGGKGIKCEWISFDDFKNDMYFSYLEHVEKYGEKNTQIDRQDNDGNYCKENCRWATRIEQMDNTSRKHLVTFAGKTQSISSWAREFGIPMKVVWYRINKGWHPAKAFGQHKLRNNLKPYASF